MVFLAGKSPYIRSYTVCTYGICSREITKYKVIYGVRTVFVAGKITIHTFIYGLYIRYFWQGNHHTYGHIRCRYMVLANPKYLAPSIKRVHTRCLVSDTIINVHQEWVIGQDSSTCLCSFVVEEL